MHRLLASLLATLCTAAFALETPANPAQVKADYQLSALQPNIEIPPSLIEEQTTDAQEAELLALSDYPDLWSRLRTGLQMPDLDTATTRKWEIYYASRPQYLNRIFERGSRYLYHVVEEIEKRGMPMEIALLPMIESAYNPRAESPARASGMWQFIPETGKFYGLERTWWYDGRRDVIQATRAALDYLTKTHSMFDDWQLALASYNWGENAVARAVAKNRAAGRPTDYAELKMPAETANYVPKLMAIRNIIANPEAFGVTLIDLPNKPYFTAIDNNRHMDVKVAAELAEIPVTELLHLNPGFIRPVIAQKDERKLVLPADKVETFQRNLASYDKPLLTWQPYVTQRGEDLGKLAQKFGIPLAELKDVNDIDLKERAARGQTILVPKAEHLDVSDRQTLAALHANRAAEPVDRGEKDKPSPIQIKSVHKVAKGETLYSIAQRYKLSVAQLTALNGIKGNNLKAGDTLKIAATKPAAKDSRQYVAKRGDTLATVAKKFNVATVDLVKWNNLGRKGLQPGSKIVIY